MNPEIILNSKLVSDVGLALLHSIWQISLVSLALLAALRILRNSSPNSRYAVSVAALAISLMLPVSTFIAISTRSETNIVTARTNTVAVADGGNSHLKADDQVSAIPTARDEYAYAVTARSVVSNLQIWWSRYVADLLPLAVCFWFLGVAVLSLRMGGGFWQLRRYRSDDLSGDPDMFWQVAFRRLCDVTGVRQDVKLVRSPAVDTPIAIGIFSPIILVPASLFLQISPHELETIIAHELIHIRRYDPLVNTAQCAIEALLFFHPGVWWISAQIRREREFAADSAVMDVMDDSHVTYARALANLEEIRLRTNRQVPRYATAANGGNFMERIQRILKIKTEVSRANSAWTAGLALVLTSVFLLALFSSSPSGLVNAQDGSRTRKIAIGFVSIPPLDRTANAPKDGDATARLLIQKLKEYKIPAIGFLQAGMISDGEKMFPVRANIARLWIDAGFEVGLGGFKHISLYDTPVDEYIANVEKNERVAKRLIGELGLPPRYFSYPYLNTGRSVEDKAKFEAWLASRGYTSVKYTFDNQEWMYSFAYDMARNDNDVNTMKEIREAYLVYMTKMLDHYEAYSTDLFGRDIPQTMVLTPSRLITDTADEFFGMLVKRGYAFVSVDEAQSDAAYKTPESFTGKGGISWFERWSMAKGLKLRHEPDFDPSVQKIWNEKRYTWNK